MTACAIRGCDSAAEAIFERAIDGGLSPQWAVCRFHKAALDAGEALALVDDGRAIVLGAEAPLQVVNFQVHTDVIGSTVTMMFGHDGIESQRVAFQMKPADARALCYWIGGGDHGPNGEELDGDGNIVPGD